MSTEKHIIEAIKEMNLNHFTNARDKDIAEDSIKNMSLKHFIDLNCNIKIEIIERFGKFIRTVGNCRVYELYDFFIALEIEDNTFISFYYAPKILDVEYDSNIFMKN